MSTSIIETFNLNLYPTSITVLFFFSYLFFLAIKYYRDDAFYPPGPTGLPLIGYLPNLGDKPYQLMDTLSKEYGDIFTIKIAGRKHIVLNSYEAIKEAYIKDGNNYLNRPDEFTTLGSIFNFKSFAFINGPEWQMQRKIFGSSMTFLNRISDQEDGTTVLEQRILEATQTMIDKIHGLNSEPTDFYSVFADSTMNVVGSLACGESLATTQPEVARSILNDTRTALSLCPSEDGFLAGRLVHFTNLVFSSKQKQIQTIRERQNLVMQRLIQAHLATFDPNNVRDYIDMFLNEKMKLQNANQLKDAAEVAEWFSVESLAMHLLVFFLAGTDTTASTMYFAIFLMAKHPQVQAKCQQELDVVEYDECKWRRIHFNDRKRLPYIEAVINEILRYSILATLPQPKKTINATNLRQYRIPANTHFITNLWTSTRDPKHWPNPFNFDPDNFFERDVPRDLASLPFSAGKRSCPGEGLARLEVFHFFTSLLREFTLSVPPGDNLVEEDRPGFNRVLSPFKVIATPRSTSN